jgi:glycosyltransferase involved in cell wall biosynthesis
VSGISVIICCYNSASRIAETLRYLSLQKTPANLPWEIIIVNNASTDNTVQMATTEWARFNKKEIGFQIVNQPVPGLSYARAKGIEASNYDYLIFCDDDNWLFENYIHKAFKLLEIWPNAAIIGAHGLPKAEIDAPEWFDGYCGYYATGPQNNNKSGIMKGNSPYVYGAGCIVRKSVISELNNINFKLLASGRMSEKLTSGEDVELCYAVSLLGYKIAYSSDLKFYHFIPGNRLTDRYLLALSYQFGWCNILHRPYFWLFNPDLPKYKRTWVWTLLISINIYIISFIKYISPAKPANKIVNKVNLKQAAGRFAAIVKLNRNIEKDYIMISNKFKALKQADH